VAGNQEKRTGANGTLKSVYVVFEQDRQQITVVSAGEMAEVGGVGAGVAEIADQCLHRPPLLDRQQGGRVTQGRSTGAWEETILISASLDYIRRWRRALQS
jgi:hypothetical protein